MSAFDKSSSRASAREIVRVFDSTRQEKEDWLALEEPLEIQVAHGPRLGTQ